MTTAKSISVLTTELKPIPVSVLPTRTPGVVIHKTPAGSHWTVTAETCGVRIGYAQTPEAARAIASALGALPIKWEAIPPVRSREDAAKIVEVLAKRLESVPSLLDWLARISTSE